MEIELQTVRIQLVRGAKETYPQMPLRASRSSWRPDGGGDMAAAAWRAFCLD